VDTLPVPRDFPLPLPADAFILQLAIVFLFLLHILFVALMVGGSLLTLVYEVRGRRRTELDALALEIAKTVTVNKSLAVVLGVAPLLVINALYGVHFYTANALTGSAWIAVVPLVALAFLITYAHKYSWHALADRKGLHIALGASGAALFLWVPLIFLANINLMLFPGQWPHVRGFLSSLLLPNVLPRYLHFVVASVAVCALFLVGYFGRQGFAAERILPGLDRAALRRELAGVALAATALQLLAGPLLLFTLPAQGVSWALVGNIALGAVLALAALWLLWRETQSVEPTVGLRYVVVCCLFTGTVVFMGYGRHLYREQALAAHRALVAERSEDFQAALVGAHMRAATGQLRVGEQEASLSPGERSFRAVCMGCHAMDTRLVGPPVSEIAQVYEGNLDGLIAWVRAPGRKRTDYPEMPPISMSEAQYRAVAEYVLEAGLGDGEQVEVTEAPAG
jgi:cytochrome c